MSNIARLAVAAPKLPRRCRAACSFLLGLVSIAVLVRPAMANMTLTDVEAVMAQAVSRAAQISPRSVIAVVDREGFVLGVWNVRSVNGTSATFTNLVANAITKAGTAAFLSSDQHAFTSRTAGFIVQQSFPPGVRNKPAGPLVGVNFSNLPFSDINKFKAPGSMIVFSNAPGLSIVPVPTPVTGGLNGSPGGVPLYKDGKLIGGIGVAGDGDGPTAIQVKQVYDRDEDVALAGQAGFRPGEAIFGSRVFIDGIRLPYVKSTSQAGPPLPFPSLPGTNVPPFLLMPSPTAFPYPVLTLGGVTGEVRQPIVDDPIPGFIDGQPRLTAAEVTGILARAAERARTTRAGIRLPGGLPAQVFISVVNNPDAVGVAPTVLGTFRTPDATFFSWDVAVQKARTAVFFSNNKRAFSTRTVGFMAQRHYPPGIEGTARGIFLGLQERFSMFPANVTNPLNGVRLTQAPVINPNLVNGITIFPGGFPLYRNGVLIGAIGISGDGVDQDDLIGASGARMFLAPNGIRADRITYRGVRLPYAKFPRNPAL